MKLVEPNEIDEASFNDFIAEFKAAGESLVPYSLNQKDLNFAEYIQSLNDESAGIRLPDGWVPASTYLLVDDDRQICGGVNIRHRLTDGLRVEGGHIGYGIRPSVRGRGYGTKILELGLLKLEELGVTDVLVTCDKVNLHSARIIEKNGGKLDSEVEKEGKMVLRFWIKL